MQKKFIDGKREVIDPEMDVSFSDPGVERFESIPKSVLQGGNL